MIDLHTHSTVSDGHFTPKEIAKMAKDNGLHAIALTDHVVVDGFNELKKELAGSNVIPIAGVEWGTISSLYVEILAIDIKDVDAYMKKCYHRRPLMEMIGFIRETDAVPVLAHPVLIGLHPRELFNYIKNLKSYGLMGIEVFHPAHDDKTRKIMLDIAEKLNLLVSGGSDYHGVGKLGFGRTNDNGHGNIYIPNMILENIWERKVTSQSYYKDLKKLIPHPNLKTIKQMILNEKMLINTR